MFAARYVLCARRLDYLRICEYKNCGRKRRIQKKAAAPAGGRFFLFTACYTDYLLNLTFSYFAGTFTDVAFM